MRCLMGTSILALGDMTAGSLLHVTFGFYLFGAGQSAI